MTNDASLRIYAPFIKYVAENQAVTNPTEKEPKASIFERIDEGIGLNWLKRNVKKYTGITYLSNKITDAIDDGDDNHLSLGERLWEGTKGAGNAVENFIGSQGLAFMGAMMLGSYVAGLAGIGKIFNLVTKGYFLFQGGKLAIKGTKDFVHADTKDDARDGATTATTGGIMLFGTIKGLVKDVKNMKAEYTAKQAAKTEFNTKVKSSRATLEIPDGEELSEITLKKAYKKASLKHHPDKGGSETAMAEVNAAYEFLLNNLKSAQKARPSAAPVTDVPVTETPVDNVVNLAGEPGIVLSSHHKNAMTSNPVIIPLNPIQGSSAQTGMAKTVSIETGVEVPSTVEGMRTAIENTTDIDVLRSYRGGMNNMPSDVKALYVQKEQFLRENLLPEQKAVVNEAEPNAIPAEQNTAAEIMRKAEFEKQKSEFIERIRSDFRTKDAKSYLLNNLTESITEENLSAKIATYEGLKYKHNIDVNVFVGLIEATNEQNLPFAQKLWDHEYLRFYESAIKSTTDKNIAAKMQMYDFLMEEGVGYELEDTEVLRYTDETNIDTKIDFFNRLIKPEKEKYWERCSRLKILSYVNEENLSVAERMITEPDTFKDLSPETLRYINKDTMGSFEELVKSQCYKQYAIDRIMEFVTRKNVFLAEILVENNFDYTSCRDILYDSPEIDTPSAKEIYSYKKPPLYQKIKMIGSVNEINAPIARQLLRDKLYEENELKTLCEFLKVINKDNQSIAKLYMDNYNPALMENFQSILKHTKENNLSLITKILTERFPPEKWMSIITMSHSGHERIAINDITDTFKVVTEENIALAERILMDEQIPVNEGWFMLYRASGSVNERIELYDKLSANPSIYNQIIDNAIKFLQNGMPEYIKSVSVLLDTLKANDNYQESDIVNILNMISENNIDMAKTLIPIKDFPKEDTKNILETLKFSDKDNVKKLTKLATKLIDDENFSNEFLKNIIEALRYGSEQEVEFAEKLIYTSKVPSKYYLKILKQTNRENIDKLDAMLPSPEMEQFLVANLDNGLTIEEILFLSRTQENILREKLVQNAKSEIQETTKPQPQATEINASPEALETITKALVKVGIPEGMAKNSYAKLCVDNYGNVDKVKLDAVVRLTEAFGVSRTEKVNKETGETKIKINVNISKNDIEQLFKFATSGAITESNGQFRTKIIDDVVALKKAGVTDTNVATGIAAIRGMGLIEMKARLNNDFRKNITKKIDSMPEKIKAQVKAQGIDLDEIKTKALTEPKGTEGKELVQAEPQRVVMRKYNDIVGTEKMALDKFKSELKTETWANPESFKAWAEEKYKAISAWDNNPNYTATGRYSYYNDARKEGLNNWIEYLESKDCSIHDDIFAKILFLENMTKEFRPDNAVTPPAISHETFERVYNEMLAGNTKGGMSKSYARINRERAIEKYGKNFVSKDGTQEGTWVRIPCSKQGDPLREEHVAMVQALSEGSCWCLRYSNAYGYLEKGDINFFIDRYGIAQTAINVSPEGEILEIEKRYNQDRSVPIPWVDVINQWKNENNYTGWEREIQTAYTTRPQYIALKEELTKLQEAGDYKGIFTKMNIDAAETPQGTFIIDKYRAQINGWTLSEFGINENALLSNVEEILSSADFSGSTVTKMPKMKAINGIRNSDEISLQDIRSLEEMGGKKITWIK